MAWGGALLTGWLWPSPPLVYPVLWALEAPSNPWAPSKACLGLCVSGPCRRCDCLLAASVICPEALGSDFPGKRWCWQKRRTWGGEGNRSRSSVLHALFSFLHWHMNIISVLLQRVNRSKSSQVATRQAKWGTWPTRGKTIPGAQEMGKWYTEREGCFVGGGRGSLRRRNAIRDICKGRVGCVGTELDYREVRISWTKAWGCEITPW